RDVLTFHVAQLAQTLLEGTEAMGGSRVRRRARRQKAYAGNLPAPLRPGGAGRGEEHRPRASEERASVHHWMSSSARCSSDGGIVRPRALAVLRLMIRSNFVGCSPGKAAALPALWILVS